MNDAPVATDDDLITNEDSTLVIAGSTLLGNDTDAEGDTLTIASIDDSATLGTVTDNGDGTYTYDPNGQFESLAVGESATDTFTYTVSDGNGGTATATVTVTVEGVNDAPVANDDTADTDENTPVSGNVLTNDTDVDGDTLTVTTTGIIVSCQRRHGEHERQRRFCLRSERRF